MTEKIEKTTKTSRFHFAPFYFLSVAGAVFHPATLLIIPAIEYYRRFNTYTVTNERLMAEFAFFNRRTESVGLNTITKLEVNQRFIQRIFNVGDIRVRTFGSEDYALVFKGIGSPYKVEELINEKVRHAKSTQSRLTSMDSLE